MLIPIIAAREPLAGLVTANCALGLGLRHVLAAGAWLGLVVLTRLETAVFAAALAGLLLPGRERTLCLRLIAGASWAAIAWAPYNWRVFSKPLSFEILCGDINLLRLDSRCILCCLIHPVSGLLF